jgi:hypothetical protein
MLLLLCEMIVRRTYLTRDIPEYLDQVSDCKDVLGALDPGQLACLVMIT